MDEAHVDEKWFKITEKGERHLLLNACEKDLKNPEAEEPSDGHVAHKGHTFKVMFLCAQARPRYDQAKNQYWDGKVGMWPIEEWVAAERFSANRPAETTV